MRALSRSSLLAVALAGPACLLPPELVGTTITTTTSTSDELTGAGSSAGTTTSAEGLTSTSGLEPSTSTTSAVPPSGAYGSFCELVGVGPDLQITAILLQPACDGGICLIVSDAGPFVCDGDPDCMEEAEGSVCGQNGLCNLSPAFIEANARCTQACGVDGDCPAIPGCQTGVTCATITLIGELCCQKVCACNDHLNPAQADDAETICDDDPGLCS